MFVLELLSIHTYGGNNMRCVITVVGKDTVGILSRVSSICAENSINIIEVTQSILQDMFCMIMLVDLKDSKTAFSDFEDMLTDAGKREGLVIHAMREDIFESMHKI